MSGGDTDEEVIEVKQETKVEVVVKETCNIDNRIEMDKNEDSDGEPPTEVKMQKVKLPEPVIENKEIQVPDKNGNTNRIRKRKRPQNRTNKSVPFKNRNKKHFQGHSKSRNQSSIKKNDFPYAFRRRRVTLLEKLLESEIRHERNVLLQCVRYTVQNNFFQGKSNCESTSEC